MPRGRALKEEMMMSKKQMPIKDKQGFPKVPEKDKFADDIGYTTKPKRLRGK